jgi:glycosyltransferase involved in cell wall biosynthesis
MKVSIVICTYGRPAVLAATVESILRQAHPAKEILIVAPSAEHVEQKTLEHEHVRFITSRRGLTIQRNAALDRLDNSDLVAFIDDDMELCRSYLANMVRLFSEQPDVIVASGRMLADGGRADEEVSRESARALCANADACDMDPVPIMTRPLDYAYGCNLMVRASTARHIRFDERLSLYAWLEDSDFSYHCTRGGKPPVTNLSSQCVHLGWRGARISGRKMGYSQIVNPIYLWKKSRVFSLRHILVQYWMRCLVANLIGVVCGKAQDERFNRLKGNTLAIWHLARGKCDPMAINQLR